MRKRTSSRCCLQIPAGKLLHRPSRCSRLQRSHEGPRSGLLTAAQASSKTGDNAADDVNDSVANNSISEAESKPRRRAESTDAVSSALTRRFGLAGGLAWVAFLTIGTLGEQIKTRLEVRSEEQGAQNVTTESTVELASGVQYVDLRIGGGAQPRKGDLVVLNFRASANGEVFEDTTTRSKPIVFPFKSRPFTGGMNAGLEEAVAAMRAGGKRKVTIPPAMGFGDKPYSLRPTLHAGDKEAVVPPNSTLEYEVTLVRVSPPPT